MQRQIAIPGKKRAVVFVPLKYKDTYESGSDELLVSFHIFGRLAHPHLRSLELFRVYVVVSINPLIPQFEIPD